MQLANQKHSHRERDAVEYRDKLMVRAAWQVNEASFLFVFKATKQQVDGEGTYPLVQNPNAESGGGCLSFMLGRGDE